MGVRRTIGRFEWVYGTGTRGSADISATIAGKSVKIEVKIKDQQSQHQKEYQRQVEAAGGIYVIARNFQEFNDWYAQNFSK
jgi:preprotein translocase subunit SecA